MEPDNLMLRAAPIGPHQRRPFATPAKAGVHYGRAATQGIAFQGGTAVLDSGFRRNVDVRVERRLEELEKRT